MFFLIFFKKIKINFFELNKPVFNKNFKISMSYTTNFRPSDFLYFNSFEFFKNKNSEKIVSRNFFLFLILLKYSKNNNFYTLNSSVFVKPNYKKFITLLRAPYRYKLSRHQFMFSRYYVIFSVKINFENLFFKNVKDLIFFIKLSKNFYFWFESNIVSQHQSKLFFKFYFKNLFLIN